MTPIEALEAAIFSGSLRDVHRSKPGRDVHRSKPGDVIQRLSEETRAKLRDLTSDDALKMRPWWK